VPRLRMFVEEIALRERVAAVRANRAH
jgi:hypothetical protein